MYYVYILPNKSKTVLYTGLTNNLTRRITEHYLQQKDKKTFCGRYLCHYVVYYEEHQNIVEAIAREKEIKGWSKEKKLNLIRADNKDFAFLNDALFDCWPPVIY
jgi:putative endonuclease